MKQIVESKGVKIGEGRPKICVSLSGTSKEQIEEEIKALDPSKVDLVEWRADCYAGCGDVRGTLQLLSEISEALKEKPLIFTLRSKEEGGMSALSLGSYMEINKAVLEDGKADFLDIQYAIGDEGASELLWLAEKTGVKTILSSHEIHRTPKRIVMMDRLHQMQMLGGDILKLAVTPTEPSDVITLMQVTNEMSTYYARGPIITMAMGQMGVVTRFTGEVFGSAVTFASGLTPSAPGQVDVDHLYEVLQLMEGSL